MSQSYAASSAANSWRRLIVRGWEDPETRSTLVGVAGVILFYLLLWLLGPLIFRLDAEPLATRPHAAPRAFNIEMAPDTFTKAEPIELPQFVETNPDAPENVPDKTNNFAERNQQVAQEKPTENGTSDRPATEGKKDSDSTQIITGRLQQPLETIEAVPEPVVTPPSPVAITAPRAEQTPLPGFEKSEGDNPATYGSNVAKIPNVTDPARERVEGQKNAPLIEGATALQPTIDPRRPQPRPQLVQEPRVRPGILAENPTGTQTVGPVAVDAKWSNYGGYLQKLINVVQIVWEDQLRASKVYPTSGSTVTVKFVLNDSGGISRIVNVESTASDLASRACVTAITERAPYGEWTDDMKALLGKEQEMTFRFYYQ